MSNTLPKEKQSAYQRWEMASFGEERPKQRVATTASIAKLSEQITAAREQARQEGYAAGLAPFSNPDPYRPPVGGLF